MIYRYGNCRGIGRKVRTQCIYTGLFTVLSNQNTSYLILLLSHSVSV